MHCTTLECTAGSLKNLLFAIMSTVSSSVGVPVTSGTDFITLSQGTLPPPKAKESKEGKDTKETKEKEFKEKESDGKDFRKDSKDNREGKNLFEFSSVGVVEPIERLARLQGAIGQLMHFIHPDLRPTWTLVLSKGSRSAVAMSGWP